MKNKQIENAVDNFSADSKGVFAVSTARNGIKALHRKLQQSGRFNLTVSVIHTAEFLSSNITLSGDCFWHKCSMLSFYKGSMTLCDDCLADKCVVVF